MKAITVRQPWAWAIMHGGKDVENRSRNIVGSYRGPVAIHAALGWSEQGAEDWEVRRALRSEEVGWPADDSETWAGEYVEGIDPRFIRGHVIGTVEIVDVHQWIDDSVCFGHSGADGEATCSPWGMPKNHHIIITNPQPFAEPIPAKGKLGLWNWEGMA